MGAAAIRKEGLMDRFTKGDRITVRVENALDGGQVLYDDGGIMVLIQTDQGRYIDGVHSVWAWRRDISREA